MKLDEVMLLKSKVRTDAELAAAAEAIRGSGKKVYIVATGGGAGLQKMLWDVPGISSALVGGSFPYAMEETDDLLGFKPEKYCSVETAIDLAQAAYMKAWTPGSDAIGVGLSASVASNREHRGDHRVHIAVFSERRCRTISSSLVKGVGPERRAIDGYLCDLVAMNLLSYEASGSHHVTKSLQDAMRNLGLIDMWEETRDELARERFFAHPYFLANGTRTADPGLTFGWFTLFPGAFNPPHEGHFGIADTVREVYNRDVTFEVTSDAPHKPALSLADMLQRAKLLKGRNRLFTEGVPLYLDKVKRYGGSIVLGVDALERMYDARWCSDRRALTDEFRAAMHDEARVFISGRVVDGEFKTSRDLFEKIPEIADLNAYSVRGRWDISSSQLRKAG